MNWTRCRHYQKPTVFQGCTVILEPAPCARFPSGIDGTTTYCGSSVTRPVGGMEPSDFHLFGPAKEAPDLTSKQFVTDADVKQAVASWLQTLDTLYVGI